MANKNKAGSDAALAEISNAGNDGGLATTLDDLIGQDAGPGVSEQADSAAADEQPGDAEGVSDEPEGSEGEDSAEESDESEEDHDEDSLSDEEKKQLKQATTERIERKIGKAHAKRREAEEKAESALQERDQLAARVAELEKNLDAVDVNAAAAASGVSDLYLVEHEADLETRVDDLTRRRDDLSDWIDDHQSDEVYESADGKEYSYAEVKQARRKLSQILDRDVPKARKVLNARGEANVTARKLYPNLFRATSPEHQEMQELLRTVPGLRARPDARLLIGRLLAGKTIEGKSSASTIPATRKAKPTAPKPPETATPAKKRSGSELQKHDPQRVRESGSWDDLL